MAIYDGGDPTHGTGADKTTEAHAPDFDAPPGENANESPGSATPDPARGGCLKLGWGCLPILGGLMLIPAAFFY